VLPLRPRASNPNLPEAKTSDPERATYENDRDLHGRGAAERDDPLDRLLGCRDPWRRARADRLLHPTYWAPTTLLDWTSVITYTCFLIAAAVSLVLLAVEQRPLSRWPITAAAAGAAAAGAANALEDGLGVSQFGYPFAAGVAVMASGLLLGGAALTLSRSGPRHLGLLLLANVAALALAFDDLGLILFGSTWLLTAGLPVLNSRTFERQRFNRDSLP
jgi:hypothetical protein